MLKENVVYVWDYNEKGEPCNLTMLSYDEYRQLKQKYQAVHMFEFLDRALSWGKRTFGEDLLNKTYKDAMERLGA